MYVSGFINMHLLRLPNESRKIPILCEIGEVLEFFCVAALREANAKHLLNSFYALRMENTKLKKADAELVWHKSGSLRRSRSVLISLREEPQGRHAKALEGSVTIGGRPCKRKENYFGKLRLSPGAAELCWQILAISSSERGEHAESTMVSPPVAKTKYSFCDSNTLTDIFPFCV